MSPLLKLPPLLPLAPARLKKSLHMRRRNEFVPLAAEEEDWDTGEGGDKGFRGPVLVEEEDEGG